MRKLTQLFSFLFVFSFFVAAQDPGVEIIKKKLAGKTIIYQNTAYTNLVSLVYVRGITGEKMADLRLELTDLSTSQIRWHQSLRDRFKTRKLEQSDNGHILLSPGVKVIVVQMGKSDLLYYDGRSGEGELAQDVDLKKTDIAKTAAGEKPEPAAVNAKAKETPQIPKQPQPAAEKQKGQKQRAALEKKLKKLQQESQSREKTREQKLKQLAAELAAFESAVKEKSKVKDKEIAELKARIAELEQKTTTLKKGSGAKKEVAEVKSDLEEVKGKVEEIAQAVQFSGFFDVTVAGYEQNPNIYALGDFELDMEKSFGQNFQVAAALVFNEDGAELAVGFIDFHLFGGPISARGRLFTEKGFHIQIGRYDIPFGNDWQYFASVDRVSVTAPLTTELVMDGGYNDVGLRILRGSLYYNLTLYALMGIEEGLSFGGRLGITPFNNPYTFSKQEVQTLEFGFSYMYDVDQDGNEEENAMAVDFESAIGPVRLQSEYISRDNLIDELDFSGFHVSLFIETEGFTRLPITFFSRYDSFTSTLAEPADEDNITRLSFGLHVNLFDISVVKLEFLTHLKENQEFSGSAFFAQIVITF